MITELTSLDLDNVKSVKGTYTVQIINEDGSIDKEVVSENDVDVEAFKGLGQRRLQTLTETNSASFIDQMKYLTLTTGDVPETSSPTFVFGKRMGGAYDGATHSPTTGSTNKSMSKVFTNADGTAIVTRRVFEWLPDSCNGTFRSIFVGPRDISRVYATGGSFADTPTLYNVGLYPDTIGTYNTRLQEVDDTTMLGYLRLSILAASKRHATLTTRSSHAGLCATPKDGVVRMPVYPTDVKPTDPGYRKFCYGTFNLKTQEYSVKPFVNLDGTTVWPDSHADKPAAALWERMLCREDGTSVAAYIDSLSYDKPISAVTFTLFNNEVATERFDVSFIDVTDTTGRIFGFWGSSTQGGSYQYCWGRVGLLNRLIFLTDNHAVLIGGFAEATASDHTAINCYNKPIDVTPAAIVIDVVQRKVVKVLDLSSLIPVGDDYRPTRTSAVGISNTHKPAGGVFTIGLEGTKNGNGNATIQPTTIQLDKNFDIKRTSNMGWGLPSLPGTICMESNGSTTKIEQVTVIGKSHDAIVYKTNNLPVFSHTLLPEAVTKTDTQSMRITYDIAVTVDPTYGALDARNAFLEQIQEV